LSDLPDLKVLAEKIGIVIRELLEDQNHLLIHLFARSRPFFRQRSNIG